MDGEQWKNKGAKSKKTKEDNRKRPFADQIKYSLEEYQFLGYCLFRSGAHKFAGYTVYENLLKRFPYFVNLKKRSKQALQSAYRSKPEIKEEIEKLRKDPEYAEGRRIFYSSDEKFAEFDTAFEDEVAKILSKETNPPHEILGIPKDSSILRIKKAFKVLIKKFHSDRCKHPQATKASQIIISAYDKLKDDAATERSISSEDDGAVSSDEIVYVESDSESNLDDENIPSDSESEHETAVFKVYESYETPQTSKRADDEGKSSKQDDDQKPVLEDFPKASNEISSPILQVNKKGGLFLGKRLETQFAKKLIRVHVTDNTFQFFVREKQSLTKISAWISEHLDDILSKLREPLYILLVPNNVMFPLPKLFVASVFKEYNIYVESQCENQLHLFGIDDATLNLAIVDISHFFEEATKITIQIERSLLPFFETWRDMHYGRAAAFLEDSCLVIHGYGPDAELLQTHFSNKKKTIVEYVNRYITSNADHFSDAIFQLKLGLLDKIKDEIGDQEAVVAAIDSEMLSKGFYLTHPTFAPSAIVVTTPEERHDLYINSNHRWFLLDTILKLGKTFKVSDQATLTLTTTGTLTFSGPGALKAYRVFADKYLKLSMEMKNIPITLNKKQFELLSATGEEIIKEIFKTFMVYVNVSQNAEAHFISAKSNLSGFSKYLVKLGK